MEKSTSTCRLASLRSLGGRQLYAEKTIRTTAHAQNTARAQMRKLDNTAKSNYLTNNTTHNKRGNHGTHQQSTPKRNAETRPPNRGGRNNKGPNRYTQGPKIKKKGPGESPGPLQTDNKCQLAQLHQVETVPGSSGATSGTSGATTGAIGSSTSIRALGRSPRASRPNFSRSSAEAVSK